MPSPERIAADYWNDHLEHNKLRIGVNRQGADTNAGAFLAWMLEGAGDILRESSKSYPDRGYMFEKLNRMKNNINSRDWRDPISSREETDRKDILKQIDNIPDTNNAFIKQVKALMVAILIRAPANVDFAREKLIPLLPKGFNVIVMSKPAENMPVSANSTLGNKIAKELGIKFDGIQEGGAVADTMQFTDPVTGSTTYGNSLEDTRDSLNKMRERFGKSSTITLSADNEEDEYSAVIVQGNTITQKFNSGTQHSLNLWSVYRPELGNIISVSCNQNGLIIHGDKKYLFLKSCLCGYGGEGPNGTKKVLIDIGFDDDEAERLMLLKQFEVVPPAITKKSLQKEVEDRGYPRILTMAEYEKNWKPKGWKIIHIGPTSTWRTEWGEWEAIRDLVQNALDETEDYRYGFDKEGLWISDNGKGVGVASFLLGPPKLKPDYARGKFGEGMKIASLALVRKGYGVHVETVGRELWMIFIEQDVGGGEKVQSLAALWKEGGTKIGTKFHILGYFEDAFSDKFAVRLPKSDILATCPSKITKPFQRYNQLLESHKINSRIYARDIYMQDINSDYSYNLWSFDMSPDRFGAKNESEVFVDIGRVWTQVKDVERLKYIIGVCSDPQMRMTDESNRIDMNYYSVGINPITGKNYQDTMVENEAQWKKAWNEVYGEDTVIRTSSANDGIVKHLGYNSQGLQWGVKSAFSNVIKTDDQLMTESQEALREVVIVPDKDLKPNQRAHLELARAICSQMGSNLKGVHAGIIPAASERVRTAGLYGRTSREIFLALSQLEDGRSTIDTTIHELAHHTSGADDAEEAHNNEMTRIAGRVVADVARKRYDQFINVPGFSW